MKPPTREVPVPHFTIQWFLNSTQKQKNSYLFNITNSKIIKKLNVWKQFNIFMLLYIEYSVAENMFKHK